MRSKEINPFVVIGFVSLCRSVKTGTFFYHCFAPASAPAGGNTSFRPSWVTCSESDPKDTSSPTRFERWVFPYLVPDRCRFVAIRLLVMPGLFWTNSRIVVSSSVFLFGIIHPVRKGIMNRVKFICRRIPVYDNPFVPFVQGYYLL